MYCRSLSPRSIVSILLWYESLGESVEHITYEIQFLRNTSRFHSLFIVNLSEWSVCVQTPLNGKITGKLQLYLTVWHFHESRSSVVKYLRTKDNFRSTRSIWAYSITPGIYVSILALPHIIVFWSSNKKAIKRKLIVVRGNTKSYLEF